MLPILYPMIEEKEQRMIETYFARTSTIDRLRSGPLGPDLDALASALCQQGYARDSIRQREKMPIGLPGPNSQHI